MTYRLAVDALPGPLEFEGYRFTKHALERALDRRMEPEDISLALHHPTVTQPSQNGLCRRQGHGDITVVVEPGEKVILTVWYADENPPEEYA